VTSTTPGFVPGADAYAPAVWEVLEMGRQIFRNPGLTDQRDFDIFTAMVAALINQQPGGRSLGRPPRNSADSPTRNRRATQSQGPRRRTTATRSIS
jgi:hypothetical protein